MNSTLAFTLMLLSLMFGAVIVSASWGYALGREALKGITQPDVRPSSTLGNASNDASLLEDLIIISEQQILDDVKARMSGQPASNDSNQSNSSGQSRNASSQTAIAPNQDATSSDDSAVTNTSFVDSSSSFPLVSQNQGVTLEVYSSRRQGDMLLLDIGIQNQGGVPVQVLEQFLRLTTDDGSILGVNIEGVPSEILPGSGQFVGVVSASAGNLQQGDRLSLTLANSSGQNLRLQIADILVPQ